MAIQKEIWENYIEGNLFKNNDFLLNSVDASQYVVQGKVVHIPQAGGKPNVVVNRSSLPASVTTRTDTDVTYEIDEHSSDPILIPNADLVELSYNKVDSVMSEHQLTINESVAERMLYNWAPVSNIYRPTGVINNDTSAAVQSVQAHTDSAIGARLKFGLWDFRQVVKMFDKANVPMPDRFALFDADMYQDLVDDLVNTKYRDFSYVFDAKSNTISELFGVKVYKRSSALIYDNSGTPLVKAPGSAGAATDNAGALFWQKNGVERAIGEIRFFERLNDPTYYGDLYSFLVRAGGRKRRANEENVIAVVQQAAA